jgi:hypothetical protein
MEDGIMNGNQGKTIQTRTTCPATPEIPRILLILAVSRAKISISAACGPGSQKAQDAARSNPCCFFIIIIVFLLSLYIYTFMSDRWAEC